VIAEPPLELGAVNAIEACAFPAVAVPIVGAPGAVAAITIEKLCVAVPATFVAVMTPLNVPAALGVPLIAPPLASVRPVGSAPEVTLKVGAGEPLAVTVKLYATPNVPPGGVALVKFGEEAGVTLTVPEGGLVPATFVAVTEHVYVVPFVRPVTVMGEAAPETGAVAPGLQVAL
jgi:hypothetical protein